MAIDIYNNDIYVTGDDFIEGDGGVHNIRIMRNRGINAAHTGLSAQPIFGGPAYYIRNVVYNTPVALKFSNPAGVIVLPQHHRRGGQHEPAGVERALREQPVSSAPIARTAIASLGGPTTVLDLRLRRIPSEQGRRAELHLGRRQPVARRLRRHYSGRRRGRGTAAFKTLAELCRGHRPGNARHRAGLRHLREPSTKPNPPPIPRTTASHTRRRISIFN